GQHPSRALSPRNGSPGQENTLLPGTPHLREGIVSSSGNALLAQRRPPPRGHPFPRGHSPAQRTAPPRGHYLASQQGPRGRPSTQGDALPPRGRDPAVPHQEDISPPSKRGHRPLPRDYVLGDAPSLPGTFSSSGLGARSWGAEPR